MPVTIAQLRATATVDLMTAAAALGLGRTKAYELARRDQFPCRVIRIGETYRDPHRRACWNCSASPPKNRAAKRLPAAAPDTQRRAGMPSPARNQEEHRDARAHGQPTATPAEDTAPGRSAAPGWQRRELVIWGAHGGAGTTTLAVWLQPAWDMGAMRPEPDPPYPATIARGRALVVACRNTAWSARQATKARHRGHPAGRPGRGAGRGQRRLARAGHRDRHRFRPAGAPGRRGDPGPVRRRLCGWRMTRPTVPLPRRALPRPGPDPGGRWPRSPHLLTHWRSTMTMLIVALAIHQLADRRHRCLRHGGRAGGERAEPGPAGAARAGRAQ